MPDRAQRPTLKAQQLRREATPAERHLWRRLSKRQLGNFKFSRQMPVGPFICDFLCRSAGLAIELDGYSHDISPERDASRGAIVAQYGIRVLHFSNKQIFENIEGVLAEIERALTSGPPPSPPACGRGEG